MVDSDLNRSDSHTGYGYDDMDDCLDDAWGYDFDDAQDYWEDY